MNVQSEGLNHQAKSSNSGPVVSNRLPQPAKSDSPANDTVETDKDILQKIFPVSQDVKEAKERVLVDVAKGRYYRKLAHGLSDSVTKMNIAIVNEKKEIHLLDIEELQIKQKMLKAVSEYRSLLDEVQRCNGRGDDLSSKELSQLADIEAKRVLKDELEPLIWYSNRNRYRILLKDLRKKLKYEKFTVDIKLAANMRDKNGSQW